MNQTKEMTTFKSPVRGCPACDNGLRHQPEHWREFHPEAGSGSSKEHGAK